MYTNGCIIQVISSKRKKTDELLLSINLTFDGFKVVE